VLRSPGCSHTPKNLTTKQKTYLFAEAQEAYRVPSTSNTTSEINVAVPLLEFNFKFN
jgi:hypothetical protein